MADVTSMGEITAMAARIDVDLSQIDLDSIYLPPGEDCGIPRQRSCLSRDNSAEAKRKLPDVTEECALDKANQNFHMPEGCRRNKR